MTFHRGWTDEGEGAHGCGKVDCFADVEGAATAVANNDMSPEWYETVIFERSCADYRDVVFRMIDRDKKREADDLVVECRYTLAEFLRLKLTRPDAGLPDDLDADWSDGKAIPAKKCYKKQCVHTCLSDDGRSGFQFAVAGFRFLSQRGCGPQPFVPGPHEDADAFLALRNASYEAGGAVSWPKPEEMSEEVVEEGVAFFGLTEPAPRSTFAAGASVPVAWAHGGAVGAKTVEIYAVPVPADARAPPRDLLRTYDDGRAIVGDFGVSLARFFLLLPLVVFRRFFF